MTCAIQTRARSSLFSRFTFTLVFLMWVTFVAVCAQVLVHCWQADPALYGLDESKFQTLAVQHNVTVITKSEKLTVRSGSDIVGGEPVPTDKLPRFAALVAEELKLYPPELFRRAGLRHAVLCSDLMLNDLPVGGLPEFRRGLIFINVEGLDFSPADLRATVHHELFHLIDFRDDKIIDSDPVWEALNPRGFRYESGGRKALADPNISSRPTDEVPGFLTTYSTSAVEEDKAEVFSFMVVHPKYVAERTRTDAVLKAKVARMRALIKSFCPEADDQFWNRIERTRVQVELP
jgi:hypothetical protein